LNVFSGISFPDNYTVYAAGFENGGILVYTICIYGRGRSGEIITYISTLSEKAPRKTYGKISIFTSDGFVVIDGRLVRPV
jgi:hypothetical protein